MKYIDAEKLIERLEEMKRAEYENCGGVNSKTGALQEVQELIESLQQEQPEVDLEKIEKASYKVFPVKKKFGVEKIKYPDREDENFSKREIWKDGVIWAIHSLGINAKKEE